MTLVTAGSPLASALLDPVAVWVAEADHLADDARTAGIPTERIRVIRPGVNLELFRPSPVPDGPFKVLFASSPQAAEEFEARGVNLLVDAARLLPDVRFVFAWRHWGNQHELRAAIDALSPPPNVEINVADVPVMATVYASVHAVAALFAPGHGKSAANSIIEGLACGRPALVSQSSGLANLLRESAAGTVVSRTPEAVAEGITQLRAHYGIAVKRARSLAESHFDQAAFVTGYLRTYDAIANRAW
ncbi:MAG TPA: glycosyltransferase [Vicinamibacterales bacterium]|nr:glycosyltransferase [Vicinamibacterales bacterium]